jgi:hypothetical protein
VALALCLCSPALGAAARDQIDQLAAFARTHMEAKQPQWRSRTREAYAEGIARRLEGILTKAVGPDKLEELRASIGRFIESNYRSPVPAFMEVQLDAMQFVWRDMLRRPVLTQQQRELRRLQITQFGGLLERAILRDVPAAIERAAPALDLTRIREQLAEQARERRQELEELLRHSATLGTSLFMKQPASPEQIDAIKREFAEHLAEWAPSPGHVRNLESLRQELAQDTLRFLCESPQGALWGIVVGHLGKPLPADLEARSMAAGAVQGARIQFQEEVWRIGAAMWVLGLATDLQARICGTAVPDP